MQFRKQHLARLTLWAASRGPDPSFTAMVFEPCDRVRGPERKGSQSVRFGASFTLAALPLGSKDPVAGSNTMAVKDGSGPRLAAHSAKRCFLNCLKTSSKPQL